MSRGGDGEGRGCDGEDLPGSSAGPKEGCPPGPWFDVVSSWQRVTIRALRVIADVLDYSCMKYLY
jgi:hypothetical protein